MWRGASLTVWAAGLLVAPIALSGCGLCFHNDCGPASVTVYLTPGTDDRARVALICFDGECAEVERTDLPESRSFERPLPAVGEVVDPEVVEVTVTLLDSSGGDLGSFADDTDIDAGQCECSTVDITWDGERFDRFN